MDSNRCPSAYKKVKLVTLRAIWDRKLRQPLLPAYWLIKANKTNFSSGAAGYRGMPYCLWDLLGATLDEPDLWGFCGSADGVLAAHLPASDMLNGQCR